jgi:hypothetical protein
MSPQSISPQHYTDFSIDYQARSILLSPSETEVSDSCVSYHDNISSILMSGYSQSTPQSPNYSSPASKSVNRIARRKFLMKSPDEPQSHRDTCDNFQSSKVAHNSQIQLSAVQPAPLNSSDLNQSAGNFLGNLFQCEEANDNATSTHKPSAHKSHFSVVSAIQKASVVTMSQEAKLKMDPPLPETNIEKTNVSNGNENRIDAGMKQKDDLWFRSPKEAAASKPGMPVRKKVHSGNLVMSITNGGRAVLTENDLYKEDGNIDNSSDNEDRFPARPKSAPGVIHSDDAINALRQVIARRASITTSNNKSKIPKRIRQNRQLERPSPRKASAVSAISNVGTIKPTGNSSALINQQIMSTRLKDVRRASYSLFVNYDKKQSTGRRNSACMSKPLKAAKKSSTLGVQVQRGSHSDEIGLKASTSMSENGTASFFQTLEIDAPPLQLSQAAYSAMISPEKHLGPGVPGYETPLSAPTVSHMAYSIYHPYQEHQQQMQEQAMEFGCSVSYPTNQIYQSQPHTIPSIPSSEEFTFPFLAHQPAQSVYNVHEAYPTSAECSYTLGNYYQNYSLVDQNYHFYQQQHQQLHEQQDHHLLEQEHNQHQFPNDNIGYANNTHMIYLSYQ